MFTLYIIICYKQQKKSHRLKDNFPTHISTSYKLHILFSIAFIISSYTSQ
nr:MAG TPA: hypothetical protein [Bacteriophage sp.]